MRGARVLGAVAGLILTLAGRGEMPPFAEVFGLVQTNLAGLDTARFNTLSVDGLLQALEGRARLLDLLDEPRPPAELIAGTRLYEGGHAYVRLGEVSDGVAPRLAGALAEMAAGTNELSGLVLDLRFAGGRDYATAARVLDLFADPGQPVLDWGEGMFAATAKTNEWDQPVAVLVNEATAGSAEAVAAGLRRTGAALLIGETTAGEAGIYRDFALSTGQRLRLAVAAVRTGDGEPIPSDGLRPDIEVKLRPEVERGYLADPFTAIRAGTNAPSGTNQLVSTIRIRRKVNEAELVRAQQQGRSPEPQPVPQETRVVRDPALARALDLLKGLSLVRRQ